MSDKKPKNPVKKITETQSRVLGLPEPAPTVLRGGYWDLNQFYLEAPLRYTRLPPYFRDNNNGFRLARTKK